MAIVKPFLIFFLFASLLSLSNRCATFPNVTVRYFLMPLFRPGDMQWIYFFERESQDGWSYYRIVRSSKNASPLTAGNEASSINRAVAFYCYLTGMPTEKEPPPSP